MTSLGHTKTEILYYYLRHSLHTTRARNLAANRSKDCVCDRKMKIFDDLHVAGGNDDTHITELLHLAALTAGDPGGDRAGSSSEAKSCQHVRRVAAGANRANHIAGAYETLQLLCENVLIAGIIGPGRDQSDVIGKGQHTQPLSGTVTGAFSQVARHVRGQRCTTSVTKQENRVAGVMGSEKKTHQAVCSLQGQQRNRARKLLEIGF